MSLLAGAGSAALAAVIGGRLGLSGTVIGAAVGSIVAAVAATTIRTSVHRSRAAAVALANRRRGGVEAVPAGCTAVEHVDAAPSPTPWSGWFRGGATVAAGFALGIAGLLLVQLGLGRNLTPGTDQLQSAAVRVVAAGPTSGSSARPAHPTATTTVTETASAGTSSSPVADHSVAPVKAPTDSPTPSGSATPSATPTPGANIATP